MQLAVLCLYSVMYPWKVGVHTPDEMKIRVSFSHSIIEASLWQEAESQRKIRLRRGEHGGKEVCLTGLFVV